MLLISVKGALMPHSQRSEPMPTKNYTTSIIADPPRPELEASLMHLRPAPCSLRELIEDELRDLWQWGYDREPREESVQPRLDAIMRFIEANAKDL